MTIYEDIVKVMSDGKARTPRQIAMEINPGETGEKLRATTSKVGTVIARKARVWGEFVVVDDHILSKNGYTKSWRMVR